MKKLVLKEGTLFIEKCADCPACKFQYECDGPDINICGLSKDHQTIGNDDKHFKKLPIPEFCPLMSEKVI